MPGISPWEKPEIINILESNQLSTYDVLYVYNLVRIWAEYVPGPYVGTTITLKQYPIINVRDLIVRAVDGATEYVYTVANGGIRYVETGTFPDPNVAVPSVSYPVIHLTDDLSLIPYNSIYVEYTTLSDVVRFDEFEDIEYETSLDEMADQLHIEVANPNYIYTKAKNYWLNPIAGGFEGLWYTDAYGRGLPVNWNLTIGASSTNSLFVSPDSSGTHSWEISHTNIFAGLCLFDVKNSSGFKVKFKVYIDDPMAQPVQIRIEEFSRHSGILWNYNTTTYKSAGTWHEIEFDYDIHFIETDYIRFQLRGTSNVTYFFDDVEIYSEDPVFDYMKECEYWIGLKDSNGNIVGNYQRKGKFFIDTVEEEIGSKPMLRVTAFSNLGRLQFSKIDIDLKPEITHYYDTVNEDPMPFIPVPGKSGVWDNGLVWYRGYRLEVDGIEYDAISIADWLPIQVYGMNKAEYARYKVEKADEIRGLYEGIDGFFYANQDVRYKDYKEISSDQYTVDYERGWLIFKEPMGLVLVDCYYILEGTNEAEDLLVRVLLKANEHPDYVNPSFVLFDDRYYEGGDLTSEIIQERTAKLAKEGGGPGFSIDELTDYSRDATGATVLELFEFDEEIPVDRSPYADIAVSYKGTVLNEAGIPNNNWVRPEDEKGFYNECVSPIYPGTGLNEVGVYIELFDYVGGMWHYWTDFSAFFPSGVYVSYKGGRILFKKSEWDSFVAVHGTGVNPMRVAYRYWTIQTTGVTSSHFRWKVDDGNIQTLFEKTRESLLAPNYLIWDDKDGKIHGNYITEKPSGSEDFVLRMKTSLNRRIIKKDIVTKVVTRGAQFKTQEFACMAWITQPPVDSGYMGTYAGSWNVGGLPPVKAPAYPIFNDDINTYISWATCSGRYLPKGVTCVGVALDGIQFIDKIAFLQPGSGGEHNYGGWDSPPIYCIEYLDVDSLREIGVDPLHIIAQEAFPANPQYKATIYRYLEDSEYLAFRGEKNVLGTSERYPWKPLSTMSTNFTGLQAGSWYEIDDLPDEFQAQYFRIIHIRGGKFRQQWSDLQFNLSNIKFVSSGTIYGVAFVRDFDPGSRPDLNDPDGEFYRPDLLRQLYPNSVRTLVIEKDTSLQSDVELFERARDLLREKLKFEDELSADVVFGYFEKLNTIYVYDPETGFENNYLLMRLNYSKSGTKPTITMDLKHYG